MPKHKHLNPDTIAKPVGYTHVVESTAPGRLIYISGQLGLDIENKIVGAPGDFRAQAEQTFVNLKNALAAVGADFTHVVKFTSYFTDIAHLGVFREVRDRFRRHRGAAGEHGGRDLSARPSGRADRGRGDRGDTDEGRAACEQRICCAPRGEEGQRQGKDQGQGVTKAKVSTRKTGSRIVADQTM
jgi:enamine deaminase RidA (YjgF/YER057c/UK114 family)